MTDFSVMRPWRKSISNPNTCDVTCFLVVPVDFHATASKLVVPIPQNTECPSLAFLGTPLSEPYVNYRPRGYSQSSRERLRLRFYGVRTVSLNLGQVGGP